MSQLQKLSQPRNKWSTSEETTLVEAILEREPRLFGAMHGCGGQKISKIKNAAWQEVADVLNSQFFAEKRTLQECRKKYYNIKTSAKAKLDEQKRPQTGGGPRTTTSVSEQLLLDRLGDRASMVGLGSAAVDTDSVVGEAVVPSTECPSSVSEPVASCSEDTDASTSSLCNNEVIEQSPEASCSKKKVSKRSYQEIAESTLELDRKRILLETVLIEHRIKESQQNAQVLLKQEIKLDHEIAMLVERRKTLDVKKELMSLKIKGITDFSFS